MEPEKKRKKRRRKKVTNAFLNQAKNKTKKNRRSFSPNNEAVYLSIFNLRGKLVSDSNSDIHPLAAHSLFFCRVKVSVA